MGKIEKLIEKLLSGNSDSNFDFDDLRKIIEYSRFNEKIRGSHHTYRIQNHNAFINIQPLKGNKAKPYQIKQVRIILQKYFIKQFFWKMNIKYEITIHWSEEDKSYISGIPELEGCIADGKTPEESLKMLEEVYEIWMESAKKYKAAIPKPKLKKKLKVA